MPLQVPSYHCLSYMADNCDWDSGLYNPIVLKDHRNPYLGGLERAMVLTFEWPVSTPKPLVWGEVSPFQCPKGWRWSKSPSFSQLIECKRASFPKALSLTFLCHSRHTMPPKGWHSDTPKSTCLNYCIFSFCNDRVIFYYWCVIRYRVKKIVKSSVMQWNI